MLYAYIKFISRIVLKCFFSEIEVNGLEHLSEKQAIIFAPNHQNALLDAVVVGATVERPIHYLTRSDVFVFPFKYFFRALYMMPVYRLRDGRALLSKNEAVFETCKDILAKGNNLLLFPEANHSLNYHLRPLSRGLSRIAYKSQLSLDHTVYVVPVGLNYFDHQHSGSKLIVNFGQAIDIEQIIGKDSKEGESLNCIRDVVTAKMKEELLIPDYNELYEIKRTYIEKGHEHLNFDRLRKKLDSVTIPNDSISKRKPLRFLEIFNLPIFLLINYLLKYKIKDEVFPASIKLGVIILIYPIYLLGILVFSLQLLSLPWSLLPAIISVFTFYLRAQCKPIYKVK